MVRFKRRECYIFYYRVVEKVDWTSKENVDSRLNLDKYEKLKRSCGQNFLEDANNRTTEKKDTTWK